VGTGVRFNDISPEDLVEDRHKRLIQKTTEIYVEWLNQYNLGDDSFVYTIEHFLDSTENEFADVRVYNFRERRGSPRVTFELNMFDGDDGGPARLSVIADRVYHYETTGRKRKGSYEEYAILEYGGNPDGTNIVAEESHTVEFIYDETRLIWDNEYTIGCIIQEFDTMFSFVYDNEGGLHKNE